MRKLKILFVFLIFSLFLFWPGFVQAQEEILEGKITNILEQDLSLKDGQETIYQKLEILVSKGSFKGQKIEVESGDISVVSQPIFKAGDGVLISYSQDFEDNDVFFVVDFTRRWPLFWLFVIFLVLTFFIGKKRGLMAILGLLISFLVIFKFILPGIYNGYDPVLVSILGSVLIVPLTFYLSHGLNKKTSIAVAGTFLSLLITGILASLFIYLTRLTGYSSEEAAFLQVAKQGAINIRGLLLAGIIIGTLGVLDDITISQAAIVRQLKLADKKVPVKKLFSRAMSVGKDHIASMINTLVLVYTGASLPLLLLFINGSSTFSQIINYEIIAEEIIRTLVGSIGLITAVPITTFLAVKLIGKKEE